MIKRKINRPIDVSRGGRVNYRAGGMGFIGAGKIGIKTNSVKDIKDYYKYWFKA